MMLQTLREFVLALEALETLDTAADLFEDNCSDELRTQIYELAHPNSPEPFRSAMYNLGYTNY